MKVTWTRVSVLSVAACLAGPALAGCGDDDGGDEHDHAGEGGSDGGPGGAGGAGGGGAGGDADGGPVSVAIAFEAVVGDAAFDCSETYDVGSPEATVMPLDFKLYVHDVALLGTNGAQVVSLEQDGAFQDGDVALLDFEDDSGSCSNGTAQTHDTITGTVPEGDYSGLRFTIGVPESRNHLNQATAPSPLNLEGMFWSWTTGYKFLRIDVAPMHAMMDHDAGDDADAGPGHAGGTAGFNVHLGSTMCMGDAAAGASVTCQRSNRPDVELPAFDPATQKIVLDLAALLADSNVMHDGGGAPGCMSGGEDPECSALFPKLGLDLMTGESSGTPSFLRIEAK